MSGKKRVQFDKKLEERRQETSRYQGDVDTDMMAQLAALKNSSKTEITSALSTKNLRVGAFVLTPTGLAIDGDMTLPDWQELGHFLKMMDDSMQWLVGDFIAHGEILGYGDQKKIADDFGFKYGTVRVYASVARNVNLLIRINSLTFAHHQLVAGIKDERKQVYWLQEADKHEWSVSQLRNAMADNGNDVPDSQLDKLFSKYGRFFKQAKKLPRPQRDRLIKFLEERLQELRQS